MVLGAVLLIALTPLSCIDDESVFTEGRLEDLCNEAIPSCYAQASCVLSEDEFYRGRFPGGMRVITRSELEEARLVVRFLLDGMLNPGTELLVQAHKPDCGNLSEEHYENIDLFELAGDDRIIEVHLDLPDRGDHLVEIFSDMSASYIMTLTVEEK